VPVARMLVLLTRPREHPRRGPWPRRGGRWRRERNTAGQAL